MKRDPNERQRFHAFFAFPAYCLAATATLAVLICPIDAFAFDDNYASIDLSTAYRSYHIPNTTAVTIDTGDTVVISTEMRYTHNGLGDPLSLNQGAFGLTVSDQPEWWRWQGSSPPGFRSDFPIANRGFGEFGVRLPVAPWIDGVLEHSNFGVDYQANLDPVTMMPVAAGTEVPQVSNPILLEWTLTINAAGFVEGVGTMTNMMDTSITYSSPAIELGRQNTGTGWQTGTELYAGFTTSWDSGFDDDMDAATPNIVDTPKSGHTNFTKADVDNFTVTETDSAGTSTFIVNDDFNSYADGDVINAALGTAWAPKWQGGPGDDGIFGTADDPDNSQQNLFVAVDAAAPNLTCDFDGDGECNIADLDMLYGDFGTLGGPFDVDMDGTVNGADIPAWLSAASDPDNLYLGGLKTFVMGDANLDGNVDSVDLGLLLNNFGDDSSLLYGAGNMNDDANVNSVDLGLMLNNFGAVSAAGFAAVPEPGTLAMLLIATMGLMGIRRRR